MTRTTIQQLKNRKLGAMNPKKRAVFDETYAAANLSLDVGQKVRKARGNLPHIRRPFRPITHESIFD